MSFSKLIVQLLTEGGLQSQVMDETIVNTGFSFEQGGEQIISISKGLELANNKQTAILSAPIGEVPDDVPPELLRRMLKDNSSRTLGIFAITDIGETSLLLLRDSLIVTGLAPEVFKWIVMLLGNAAQEIKTGSGAFGPVE